MRDSEWSKILGWPGYRVYQSEINESAQTLRLWVRRKRGNHKLVCSGCGKRVGEIVETYEWEVRDLPWSQYRATVVIELHRMRCPDLLVSYALARSVYSLRHVDPGLNAQNL